MSSFAAGAFTSMSPRLAVVATCFFGLVTSLGVTTLHNFYAAYPISNPFLKQRTEQAGHGMLSMSAQDGAILCKNV